MGDLVTVQTVDTITNAVDKTSVVDVGYAQPGGTVPTGSAGGDLSGTFPSPTVTGAHLASPLPLAQGGTGNTTGRPSGTAGGDLSGSYPNPAVGKVSASALIGLQPSGDTSGSADTSAIQALLTAATAGSTVPLGAGTFYISAPLSIPSGVELAGSHGSKHIESGTTITLASGFSGASAISFPSSSSEQRVTRINIDGSLVTANTVIGINAVTTTGAVQYVQLNDVLITGAGISNGVKASATGSNLANGWRSRNVVVLNAGSTGILLSGAGDHHWTDSQSIGSGSFGWSLNGIGNSIFTACRADFAAQVGWFIQGAWGTGAGSGGVIFNGCTTDRNGQSGVLVTATGSVPFIFNGLMCRRDGSSSTSGGYAGLRLNGATCPVIVNGITVWPGPADDGTGNVTPQYGISMVGSSAYLAVSGGYVQGVSSAINDDGSNTYLFADPNVILATGSNASVSYATLAQQFKIGRTASDIIGASSTRPVVRITDSNASATQAAIEANTAASGNPAIAARVTGDGFNRLRVNADGTMRWGPGSGSQDTNLYRSATGELRTDNNLSAGGQALGIPKPTAQGMAAWAYDPSQLIGNVNALTAGTIYLTSLYLPVTTTISKVYFSIQQAATSITAGQNFAGIYDTSGNLQASQGIDSVIAGTGAQTVTFSAPATNLPAGMYWVAWVYNATGTGLALNGSNTFAAINSGCTTSTYRSATNATSQTSLPNTITVNSNVSQVTRFYWAAIGP